MNFSDEEDKENELFSLHNTHVLEQAAKTMRREQAQMPPPMDSSTDFEKSLRDEELQTVKHKNARMAEEREALKDDRKARKIFSRCVFGFVVLYVIATMSMLAVNNMSCHLSENVLITLLSTTSINIIGLLAAVVRYLFPHRL